MRVANTLQPAHSPATALVGAFLWLIASAITAPTVAETQSRAENGRGRIVLELFTSQGCSACPPADALLGRLAARSDVIALSLAVDYWDYLGWKDTLASSVHSQRQRAYAKRRGDGMVYTPQIVVHGRHHVNGARSGEIDAAIASAREQSGKGAVEVKIRSERGGIVVDVGARTTDAVTPTGGETATIWLAAVDRRVEVPIRSGENRGKRITYFNVVRSLRSIGEWSGRAHSVRLDWSSLGGAQAVVVLLQAGSGGQLLAAAELSTVRRPDPLPADQKR